MQWLVKGFVALVVLTVGCADEKSQVTPSYYRPGCGNGLREPGELCDDGNVVDGDGCPASCLGYCGDAIIFGAEECEDGNSVDGDGCSHCRVPGAVLWTSNLGCRAELGVSPNGDIRVTCLRPEGTLLMRFPVAYSQEEMQKLSVRSPFVPSGSSFWVAGLVETADAIYAVAQVNSGTGTNQSRTRVCKLDSEGNRAWCTEITTYPGGNDEIPETIAVNAAGTVAVVGTAAVTATETRRFVAIIDNTGTQLRRTELAGVPTTGVSRAVIDATERVLIVGKTVDDGVTLWGVDPAGTATWSQVLGIGLEVVDLQLNSNGDADMLVLESSQRAVFDITTTGFTTMQYAVALQNGTLSSKRITGPAMASSEHKVVRYAAAPSNYLVHITNSTMATAYGEADWSPWHLPIEMAAGNTLVSAVGYGPFYCSLVLDNSLLTYTLTCYLVQ